MKEKRPLSTTAKHAKRVNWGNFRKADTYGCEDFNETLKKLFYYSTYL
jgi:hypothetical protein